MMGEIAVVLGHKMFFRAGLVVGVNGRPEPRLRQVEMFPRSTATEGMDITVLHGSSRFSRLYKKAQGEFTMMRGYEIVYLLTFQLLCNLLFL
jgi:hypothetical protein